MYTTDQAMSILALQEEVADTVESLEWLKEASDKSALPDRVKLGGWRIDHARQHLNGFLNAIRESAEAATASLGPPLSSAEGEGGAA